MCIRDSKKVIVKFKDFHKADIKATWADIEKARVLLGWTPKIGIEEGIKRTVDWFRKNENFIYTLKIID